VNDPHELERFVQAQEEGGAHARALTELREGQKRSHWMWFVFPQLAGLGRSPMARRYAIASVDEAVAYLAHPVLGPRLRQCAEILLELDTSDAETVFGALDAMKLRSSMTLFARAAGEGSVFEEVLERSFAGAEDERTLDLLAEGP
jgi:uncharacterized protein (DUF1810 family)